MTLHFRQRLHLFSKAPGLKVTMLMSCLLFCQLKSMYEETAEHERFLMRAAGRGSSVENSYARSRPKLQIRGAQVLTFDVFTSGL